ncbi:MAG: hypothetical protein RIQ31_992, partial [Actinomycetota bacterium]
MATDDRNADVPIGHSIDAGDAVVSSNFRRTLLEVA